MLLTPLLVLATSCSTGDAARSAAHVNDRDRAPASVLSRYSYSLGRDFFGTLKKMHHEELDELYYYGTVPSQLPMGKFDGIPLIYNAQQEEGDTFFERLANGIEGLDLLKGIAGLAWQGKVFKSDGSNQSRDLDNRLLFVAEKVRAKVFKGKMLKVLDERFGVKRNFPGKFSEGEGMLEGDGLNLGMGPVRIDGGDSIIIDYRDAGPRSMRPIVDEIRLIEAAGDSHYLGRATYRGQFALFFALQPKAVRGAR